MISVESWRRMVGIQLTAQDFCKKTVCERAYWPLGSHKGCAALLGTTPETTVIQNQSALRINQAVFQRRDEPLHLPHSPAVLGDSCTVPCTLPCWASGRLCHPLSGTRDCNRAKPRSWIGWKRLWQRVLISCSLEPSYTDSVLLSRGGHCRSHSPSPCVPDPRMPR